MPGSSTGAVAGTSPSPRNGKGCTTGWSASLPASRASSQASAGSGTSGGLKNAKGSSPTGIARAISMTPNVPARDVPHEDAQAVLGRGQVERAEELDAPAHQHLGGPLHIEGERLGKRAAHPALGGQRVDGDLNRKCLTLRSGKQRRAVHVHDEEQAHAGRAGRHRHRQPRNPDRAPLLPTHQERC